MENRLLSVESCGEPLKGDSHALQHTVHSAAHSPLSSTQSTQQCHKLPRLVYSFSGVLTSTEPAEASMTCLSNLLLWRPWQDLQ